MYDVEIKKASVRHCTLFMTAAPPASRAAERIGACVSESSYLATVSKNQHAFTRRFYKTLALMHRR